MTEHEIGRPARAEPPPPGPPGENARLWNAEVRRRASRAQGLVRDLEARLSDARAALESFGTPTVWAHYPLAERAARLDATLAELALLDDLAKGGLAPLPELPGGEPGFNQADAGGDTCAYCGEPVRYTRTGGPGDPVRVKVRHTDDLPPGTAPHPAIRAHAPILACAVCGRPVRPQRFRPPGDPVRLVHVSGPWPPGDPHQAVLAPVTGLPYTVACPECKRPPGERCILLGTHEPADRSHRARWEAASAAEAAQIKAAQARERGAGCEHTGGIGTCTTCLMNQQRAEREQADQEQAEREQADWERGVMS